MHFGAPANREVKHGADAWYYCVKYLWAIQTLCFRSAVCGEAGPGEEQILNSTTRPWGIEKIFTILNNFPQPKLLFPSESPNVKSNGGVTPRMS
jgi:hypothetical protein